MKNTLTRTTDDLDGTEAANAASFGWGGDMYEIDLSEKNLAAFQKALAKYVKAARPVVATAPAKPSPARRKTKTSKTSGMDVGLIRAWAQANGYPVSTRGRIAQSVRDAYESARV